MTRDELAQDLSYVRAIAEDGQKAPLIGGSVLIYFGVLLTVAYSIQWALLTGQFGHTSSIWFPVLWISFGLAMSGVGLLRGRVRKLPGASSMANRTDGVIWQGVGVAILAVVIGAISHSIAKQDFTAPNLIMAFGFGAYGVALRSTAILSDNGWLRPFALLSFVLSAVLLFFLDEPWTYLLAAAGCVAVLILPGVVMMQREPKPLAA